MPGTLLSAMYGLVKRETRSINSASEGEGARKSSVLAQAFLLDERQLTAQTSTHGESELHTATYTGIAEQQ